MRSVLFVCVGNSCRSQMAEGFARAYGSDVMRPWSAGLAPASTLAPLTRQVMLEKNIALDAHFPKGFDFFAGQRFDIVLNISGMKLPPELGTGEVRHWMVADPIGEKEGFYRQVRDQIESLVMQLILQLRTEDAIKPGPAESPVAGPGGEQVRIKFRGTGPARKD